MGAHRLRILHVSDLHVVDPAKDRHRQRRGLVLGKAWDENLDVIAKDGPIDLVCFTGDLAFSGHKAEYDRLTVFVEALLARVSVPKSRFFVVPGNHDADRKIAPDAVTALRKIDDEKLSAWLLGGSPPPGAEATHLDAVLKRQGAYRRWVRSTLKRPALLPGKRAAHPTLGYRETIRVRDLPFDIHVIGLDSAWLAHDDNDARKLRLTRDQVLRLSAGPDGETLGGFRLALIHHPLTDLADGEASRRLLAEQVDLLLRGHLHESELSFWADADRGMRELTAGSLYGGDMWPNGCQVVDISLDDEGHPSGYDLWFRGWSSRGRGFWIDQDGLYKGSKNGRISWPPNIKAPKPLQRPQGVFVGREKELAALEATLLPASGASQPVTIGALQGMPGVGKSYLGDRFAVIHKDRFPGGYVKLSLNADETRSADELGSALANQLHIPWQGEGTWELIRARLLAPRALLHIENADAETSAKATVALVRRLDGCVVIVSGRIQGLGDRLWTQIVIATLDEEKAIDLLQKEAGPEVALTLESKKKLACELGYLPLALHLASGHLRAKVSVELFLRRLRNPKNLLGLEPRNLLLDKSDERGILSRTFALSLDLLKKACGENGETWLQSFATLGHAPASGVGKSLGAAMAGLSEDDFEDLMDKAVQLSLATRSATARMAWSVHPLLGELLRERMGQDIQWTLRTTQWFLVRLPQLTNDRHEEQERHWKEISQESESLASWLPQSSPVDALKIALSSSSYAAQNGPFLPWIKFCENSLAQTEDPDIRSVILRTLSNTARRAGLLDKSLAAAESMAHINENRGADLHTAYARDAIADVYHTRGNYDEALLLHREALNTFKRLGAITSQAITLSKIADNHKATGNPNEALAVYLYEVLPIFNQLGDIKSRTATLFRMVDIIITGGKLEEALQIIHNEILPFHSDAHSHAVAMSKIGNISHRKGDTDEAIRLYRDEVIPIVDKQGDMHALIMSRAQLAQLLLARKRPEDRNEASDLLRIALRDAEAMGIPEAAQIRNIQRLHHLI